MQLKKNRTFITKLPFEQVSGRQDGDAHHRYTVTMVPTLLNRMPALYELIPLFQDGDGHSHLRVEGKHHRHHWRNVVALLQTTIQRKGLLGTHAKVREIGTRGSLIPSSAV